VSLNDKTVDLLAGGFDMAVRIGTLSDSALIARKIAPVRGVVVASPRYLEERGRPAHPRELADHDLLFYTNIPTYEQWRFRVGNRWEHVKGHARFRADNGDMLREAACAGLGIVALPSFIASNAIRSGGLEVILRDFPLEEIGLHLVMPPGRASTARIRALMTSSPPASAPSRAGTPAGWPSEVAEAPRRSHAGPANLRCYKVAKHQSRIAA
jgi:DNA-binding transcriptional LysR family regulator